MNNEDDLIIPPNFCAPTEFEESPAGKFPPSLYLKYIAPKLDRFLSSLETREQQVYGHLEPDAEKKNIHPHQKVRNVPKAYPEVYYKLKDFKPSREDLTFEELYHEIDTIIRPITHIGNLAVYDISVRIGWQLPVPITPADYVYLQQGAKYGAERLLGRKIKGRFIPISEIKDFVAPISRAHHIEDYLCQYHKYLNKNKSIK